MQTTPSPTAAHGRPALTVLLVGLFSVLLSGLTVVAAGAAQASPSRPQVQRRLNALGCAAGPADGRLGLRTQAALVRFQSANRLRRTGTLTPATRSRLFADAPVHCDRRPAVVRSGNGRRVVVSQQQNYVWLVTADGTVLAQGGVVDNPQVLRPGTYRAGSACGRPARVRDNSDASGRLRLHNFVRFAPCGVGFHQIPQYRTTGAQIQPDYLLGTDYRQSHGCIRVSRAMSGSIWHFATPGTKVVVVR